jgi:predicted PurR-regulated permease PerM
VTEEDTSPATPTSAPPTPAPTPAPAGRHWPFWLAVLAVSLLLVYLLRAVLLPFVAGAAVAYFLDPSADWLERRGLSRMMATVVITVAFLVLFVAGLLLLIPALNGQVSDFLDHLPDYAEALESRIKPMVAHVAAILPASQVEKLQAGAGAGLGEVASWAGGLIKQLLTSSLALINVLSLLVITPVVAFYLLRDWDRMVATIDGWLPRAHRAAIGERMREIDRTLAGFVRGQATVCLALGTFYAIGLSIVGLDLGLVVGLAAGLISFIPYVGSIVGFVVSVALAIAQFGEAGPVLAVAGVFLVGQFIEGNFLSPYLVGERVGLHPVWVIFALLAGGSLFGFLGVLLAVPVAAVAGVLVRHALGRYLDSPLYGQGPQDQGRREDGSRGRAAGGEDASGGGTA